MCSVGLALGGAMAFGQLASYSEEAEYAAEAETARLQRQANAKYYRRQVESYNNETYRQDIEYANELLDYQRSEFERQQGYVDDAVESIQNDYIVQIATLLRRGVEESIATRLQGEEAVQTGRRASAQAAVQLGEGNTARMLLGDVERQVGEALTSFDRNRVATENQMRLEALGLKARADTAINQIPIQTFQPITPPKPPAPTSPVNPTAPTPQPSPLQAVIRAGTAFGQGYLSGLRIQNAKAAASGSP